MTKPSILTAPAVTYCNTGTGVLYRITEGKCYASISLDSGEWREVITTAAQLLAALADGSASLCNELGEPVTAVEEVAPLVDVVVYFDGTMKGEACPAYGMKHVTKAETMEAAIAEACIEFEVAKVRRVFVNNVEVEAPAEVAPAEWVYFQCKATSGWDMNIRRVRASPPVSATTAILVNGSWEASRLTLGQMRTMVAFGSAEFVDAPEEAAPADTVVEEAPAEVAPDWVYFVRLGTTNTLRRYDASNPNGKAATYFKGSNGEWYESVLSIGEANRAIEEGAAVLCNEFGSALPATPGEPEATDPVTGTTYRVAKDGGILSKPAGGPSFFAAVCNTHTIQTLIRLGLVSVA